METALHRAVTVLISLCFFAALPFMMAGHVLRGTYYGCVEAMKFAGAAIAFWYEDFKHDWKHHG
jgi:hypothetical protein